MAARETSDASPQADANDVGRIAFAPSDSSASHGGLSDSAARGPTYIELSTRFDSSVKIFATQGNLERICRAGVVGEHCVVYLLTQCAAV